MKQSPLQVVIEIDSINPYRGEMMFILKRGFSTDSLTHRINMKYILPILLFLFSTQNTVHSLEYLGPNISDWPQTESRKVKDNFAAWLLITPDCNWQQKWDTPPDVVPHFNEVGTVKKGQEIVILSFYVNPKTDTSNNAHVLCSLKVTRPDGTQSINQENIVCIKDILKGSPYNVRLSPAVLKFIGKEEDPIGIWIVEVKFDDVIRNVSLNLKTQFELQN